MNQFCAHTMRKVFLERKVIRVQMEQQITSENTPKS